MSGGKGYQGPKSFSDEVRRMPIDFQRRVRWTLRIGAAWFATILIGAGVFLASKPYMDRRREEKIKSGEFFKEIEEAAKPYKHMKRSWESNKLSHDASDKDIEPPGYLLDVIGNILQDEKDGKAVEADLKKATSAV